jgi:hypothetical protein
MLIAVPAMSHGCRVVDNRSLKGSYHGDCDEGTDLAHGKGDASGVDRYVGEFVDGRPSGRGLYTWQNGARLDGTFRNGLAQGPGVFLSATGVRYEGKFNNGKLPSLKPEDCPRTPGPLGC